MVKKSICVTYLEVSYLVSVAYRYVRFIKALFDPTDFWLLPPH